MASKRALKRRHCSRKTRFSNQTEAVKSLIKYKKNTVDYMGMRTYKCRFCKGWHLGH